MLDFDAIHIFALKDNRIFDLNHKVEEMQKALDRIHTDSTDVWAVGYSLRVLQALKGGSQ